MIYVRTVNLLSRILLWKNLHEIVVRQRKLLDHKNYEIEVLKQQSLLQQLEAERRYLELVIVFRRQIDEPDYDLPEKLEGMISDVSDFVARMEEHIC